MTLSSYPSSYDVFQTKYDYTTRILADHVNKLQDVTYAIEHELGIGLRGNYNTLNDRISHSIDDNGNIINNYTNVSGRQLLQGEVVVFNPASSLSITASGGYGNDLVAGVVSELTGIGELTPVVQNGVAPVRIIAENGDISVGDYLTTANVEGYATKAQDASIKNILGRSTQSITNGSSGIYNMLINVDGYQLPTHTHLDDGEGGALGYGAVNSTNFLKEDSYTMENLTLTGSLTMSGDLNVDDIITSGNIDIGNDLNVAGDINLTGSETISGNLFIDDNLIVNGNTQLGNYSTDSTTINGTLNVFGTTVSSTGNIQGIFNFGSTDDGINTIYFDPISGATSIDIIDCNTISVKNASTVSVTAEDLTITGDVYGTIKDSNVYIEADNLNKTLYNALMDDDISPGSEYAKEPNTVQYVSANSIRINSDVTTRYHENKRLQMITSTGSKVEAIVDSSSYSAPWTTIVLTTSVVPATIYKVRFYAASQENLGITDLSNPTNDTLLDHVQDETIHNAVSSSALIYEDLTSQIDGLTSIFTISNVFKESSMTAYLDGLRLRETYDYSVDGAAKTLTTTSTPISGQTLICEYELALQNSTFLFNEDLTSTTTGTTSAFNTTYKFKPNSLKVYLDGSRQRQSVTADYQENGYQAFTMTSAPASGSELIVDYDTNWDGNAITLGGASFTIDNTLTDSMTDIVGWMAIKLSKFVKIQVTATNAPSGGNLELDVKKNGSSIFEAANRPILLEGETTGDFSTFKLEEINEKDLVTVDVISVGSIVPGGDRLYLNIITQEY